MRFFFLSNAFFFPGKGCQSRLITAYFLRLGTKRQQQSVELLSTCKKLYSLYGSSVSKRSKNLEILETTTEVGIDNWYTTWNISLVLVQWSNSPYHFNKGLWTHPTPFTFSNLPYAFSSLCEHCRIKVVPNVFLVTLLFGWCRTFKPNQEFSRECSQSTFEN